MEGIPLLGSKTAQCNEHAGTTLKYLHTDLECTKDYIKKHLNGILGCDKSILSEHIAINIQYIDDSIHILPLNFFTALLLVGIVDESVLDGRSSTENKLGTFHYCDGCIYLKPVTPVKNDKLEKESNVVLNCLLD